MTGVHVVGIVGMSWMFYLFLWWITELMAFRLKLDSEHRKSTTIESRRES